MNCESGPLRIGAVIGFHGGALHEILDLGFVDEIIRQLAQAGMPRDQRRGHGELHAEFCSKPGLGLVIGLVIAQHAGIAAAQVHRHALDARPV